MMTVKISKASLIIAMAFLITCLCSCEEMIKNIAADTARNFNERVNKAETQKDAEACIEQYVTVELHYLGLKTKHGWDAPLAQFYQSTSNSLVILQTKFNVHPKYNKFDSFLKKISED